MRKLKKSIRIFRYICYHVLTFINCLTPKYKKKIFIYDSTFRKDNLWALYDYLVRENFNTKYKIIYFVDNINIKTYDRNKNVIFISNNIKGLYHQLTSKYVFWGFGAYRFMCKPRNGQKVINLWHGSPLKSVGILANDNSWYRYKDTFSYIICASDFFKQIMKKCFDFDNEQGIILGAPRNDYLFSKKNCLSMLNINRNKYSKIILWMPTFRKSAKNNYYDSDIDFPLLNNENVKDLNKFLLINKMLLIIKPHPLQEQLPFLQKKYSNIMILLNSDLTAKSIELYELLGQVDILLTDYSSVYFDFLLVQKPIGFILSDFDEYNDKRGFTVENPLELMPGEKIYDYEGLIKFLNNIMNGKDYYENERKKINDLANKYQDDKNCERLLEFLNIKK